MYVDIWFNRICLSNSVKCGIKFVTTIKNNKYVYILQ